MAVRFAVAGAGGYRVPSYLPGSQDLPCEHPAAWIADAVLAAGLVGLGLATEVTAARDHQMDAWATGAAQAVVGPMFFVGGALYASSASYGGELDAKCRQAAAAAHR